MEKARKKTRDIVFHSEKNGEMVTVHSEAARAYSKYLEERPEVLSYESCKLLERGRLNSIQKTDIRGEYFSMDWTSDFYIHHADGTFAVREVISESDLMKRAEIEKLELSRRYWAVAGVHDWKLVITKK